jgi:hypothetical protein
MRSSILSAALAGGSLLASGTVLSASPIVTADAAANDLGETTLPSSSGIGSAGFLLFDYNGLGMRNGVNYATGVALNGYASDYSTAPIGSNNGTATHPYPTYTTLTTAEGTIATGVVYQFNSTGNTNLLTITLGAGTPSSFILSTLVDNGSGNSANDDDAVTVTPSGSSPAVTESIAGTNGGTTKSNDFYSFLITNAASGDTITIGTTPNASDGATTALLGGVAFEATPEPCSIAVISLGGLGLLLRRRARRITV